VVCRARSSGEADTATRLGAARQPAGSEGRAARREVARRRDPPSSRFGDGSRAAPARAAPCGFSRPGRPRVPRSAAARAGLGLRPGKSKQRGPPRTARALAASGRRWHRARAVAHSAAARVLSIRLRRLRRGAASGAPSVHRAKRPQLRPPAIETIGDRQACGGRGRLGGSAPQLAHRSARPHRRRAPRRRRAGVPRAAKAESRPAPTVSPYLARRTCTVSAKKKDSPESHSAQHSAAAQRKTSQKKKNGTNEKYAR